MKQIQLSQGQIAIVDDEDFEQVAQYKWSVQQNNTGIFYAYRTEQYSYSPRKARKIYLHRIILDAPSGLLVDHINHNGLDNRKCNLRLATSGQNQSNARTPVSKTGFRGVTKHRRCFIARIICKKNLHYIGCFKTAEEAARAYDEKAKELHGEFATLNFPEKKRDNLSKQSSGVKAFVKLENPEANYHEHLDSPNRARLNE